MTSPSLQELQELERRYVVGTYARAPVQFVRGSGVRLWDSEGNEYLDFLAGISVLNVGHCHPRVVAAVRDQVGLLTHASNLFYTAPAMQLSQALAESSLGGIADFSILGWAWRHERHQVDLADFPNVKRWYETMMARPGTKRGFEVALN